MNSTEDLLQLKEELATLSKRNADLEAQVRCYEQLNTGISTQVSFIIDFVDFDLVLIRKLD